MTCIKKIDWLRHLYYESTRWQNSLTGHVKWREMTAKDPNNGSKMTIKDLEATLPNMLQDCLGNKSVPSAYLLEVEYFLATIGHKIDKAVLSDLVQSRKQVLTFKDSFEMFDRLSERDQNKIVNMLDTASIHTAVRNLVTILQRKEVQARCEVPKVEDNDRSSKFKLIDWLRHMYLVCQKLLNNEAGQVQWKKLNAQDPNNSKDGKRLKLEELKHSLMVLVPGLQDDIVPKSYMAEIAIIRRVLCCNEGKFVNKDLSAEEHLRKVSLKLEDVFKHLGDPQTVFETMESSQLPWVLSVLLRFKEQLQAVPDFLENEISEEAVDEVEYLDEVEGFRIQENEVQENQVQEGLIELLNEDTDDGTKYLNDIINRHSELKHDTSVVTAESVPSIPSDISAPPSPSSPDRHSVDEQLSDDSGFSSPKWKNPFDRGDPDVFNSIDCRKLGFDFGSLPDDCLSEDLSSDRHLIDEHFSDDSGFCSSDPNNPFDLGGADKCEDIGWDSLRDLDYTCLSNVYLPEEKFDLSKSNKKRRLSYESYEEPTIKKAKP